MSCSVLIESDEESNRSEIIPARQTENPEYVAWKKTDKMLQSWMFSSMVDNVLIMVINCETSQELWKRLDEIFMSQSKACYMPLLMQIQSTEKCSLSVSDCFNKMKKIFDSLAIGGNALSSNEFIMYVLAGLDDSYESLVTNVLTRLEKEKISVEELLSMLLSHEIRLEMSKGKAQFEMMHDMGANFVQKGQNYNKANAGNNMAGNGGYANSFGGDKNVICQICFILGHGAYKCKNRFNHTFVPKQGKGNARGFKPRGGQFFGGNFGRRGLGRGLNGGFNGNFPGIFCGNGTFQGYVAYQPPLGYQPQMSPSFMNCHGAPGVYNTYAPAAMYAGNAGPSSGNVSSGNVCNASGYNAGVPLVDYNVVADPAWDIDSGATDHVTQNAGIYLSYSNYTGVRSCTYAMA